MLHFGCSIYQEVCEWRLLFERRASSRGTSWARSREQWPHLLRSSCVPIKSSVTRDTKRWTSEINHGKNASAIFTDKPGTFFFFFQCILTLSPLPVDPDLKHSLQHNFFSDSVPMCVVAVPQGELRIWKALWFFWLNLLTAAALLGQSPDLLVCESLLIAPQMSSLFCFFSLSSHPNQTSSRSILKAPFSHYPRLQGWRHGAFTCTQHVLAPLYLSAFCYLIMGYRWVSTLCYDEIHNELSSSLPVAAVGLGFYKTVIRYKHDLQRTKQ